MARACEVRIRNNDSGVVIRMSGGRRAATPVAVICDGTMPGERTVLSTLAKLSDDLVTEQVRPPAIIVVGDVVAVAHPRHFS